MNKWIELAKRFEAYAIEYAGLAAAGESNTYSRGEHKGRAVAYKFAAQVLRACEAEEGK